jgi:hypothetical protein
MAYSFNDRVLLVDRKIRKIIADAIDKNAKDLTRYRDATGPDNRLSALRRDMLDGVDVALDDDQRLNVAAPFVRAQRFLQAALMLRRNEDRAFEGTIGSLSIADDLHRGLHWPSSHLTGRFGSRLCEIAVAFPMRSQPIDFRPFSSSNGLMSEMACEGGEGRL